MEFMRKGKIVDGFNSVENYSDRERHLFPLVLLTYRCCSSVARRQKPSEAINIKRKLLRGHYPSL